MNHPRDEERKVTKARQTPSPRLVRQGWGPPKGGRGFGELLQTWRQAMSLLGSEPSKPEMARAAKPGTWRMGDAAVLSTARSDRGVHVEFRTVGR